MWLLFIHWVTYKNIKNIYHKKGAWNGFLNSSTVIFGASNFTKRVRLQLVLGTWWIGRAKSAPPPPPPKHALTIPTELFISAWHLPWPSFPPVAARAVASHWIHRRNSPFYRERERGGGVQRLGGWEGDRHVSASLFTQQTHQWNGAVNIVPHSHADTVKKEKLHCIICWSVLTGNVKQCFHTCCFRKPIHFLELSKELKMTSQVFTATITATILDMCRD